jgi:glycosidase
LIDGKFEENPGKWTGNGSRLAKPDINDWYETVKINYGIKPDGSKDFHELPKEFAAKSVEEHFAFWKDKNVPSSWKKFRDIALYWTAKGVDGFRYDMAEMVPYEFWSYMNSAIKMQNTDAFLMAEVYNPAEYRNYIHFGKMDYLYDKVETYDYLKDIIQGKKSPDGLTKIQAGLKDIEHHMLHFLDNHDEQRLANAAFAGSPEKGKPLMVVSATIGTSPTMIYFGQEVGEAATFDSGFGTKTRTSIFDYAGVPSHQRWMNGGKFDGEKLSQSEKELRNFYKQLLNFTKNSTALMGDFDELQTANRNKTANFKEGIYAFVRYSDLEKLVIVTNFSWLNSATFDLVIPAAIISKWKLKDGKYPVTDQLFGKKALLKIENGEGVVNVEMDKSESFIFKL